MDRKRKRSSMSEKGRVLSYLTCGVSGLKAVPGVTLSVGGVGRRMAKPGPPISATVLYPTPTQMWTLRSGVPIAHRLGYYRAGFKM